MEYASSETVLIIGGTGQIGTQVTVQELEAGKNVHVVGRAPATSHKVDFVTRTPNGHYAALDVSANPKALGRLIQQVKPAKIYYLAEPFPMKDEDVSKAISQQEGFYHAVKEAGFAGPIVVVGTAGIEGTGQGFPLNTFSGEQSRVYSQLPYFQTRTRMVQAARAWAQKGLDIRRVALPWVVSGDAHHGDLEPLPLYASGTMDTYGIQDIGLDAIPAQEAARAIRFVADKGDKGWTYQASGVPNTSNAELVRVELAEIGAHTPRTAPSSRERLLGMAETMLSFKRMKNTVERVPLFAGLNLFWEGYARSMFNISSKYSLQQTQVMAATACALLTVLPPAADTSALAKIGFVPASQKTLRDQLIAESKKHARLLLKDGIVPRPPSAPPRYGR